jgi:hypothetical protein
MSQALFVCTRKGLFRFQRTGGRWQQTYVAFLGQPVTAFLADARTGNWFAALSLGHFGAKLHRSTDQGATWEELTMPALPKSDDKDAPSLNQIWALEAGGADQPGLVWVGSLPAALFRNDRNGEGDWQLVQGLWNLPDRTKWFGGGTDETALHSVCVDPRNSSRIVIAVSCGGVWRSEDAGDTWACQSKGVRHCTLTISVAWVIATTRNAPCAKPPIRRNQRLLLRTQATKSNPARPILDKPLESAHFQGITG